MQNQAGANTHTSSTPGDWMSGECQRVRGELKTVAICRTGLHGCNRSSESPESCRHDLANLPICRTVLMPTTLIVHALMQHC